MNRLEMTQSAVQLHREAAVSASWEGTAVRRSERGVPNSGQRSLLAIVGRP
jgi:hypothetical protein